jgi:hypothetical protein
MHEISLRVTNFATNDRQQQPLKLKMTTGTDRPISTVRNCRYLISTDSQKCGRNLYRSYLMYAVMENLDLEVRSCGNANSRLATSDKTAVSFSLFSTVMLEQKYDFGASSRGVKRPVFLA